MDEFNRTHSSEEFLKKFSELKTIDELFIYLDLAYKYNEYKIIDHIFKNGIRFKNGKKERTIFDTSYKTGTMTSYGKILTTYTEGGFGNENEDSILSYTFKKKQFHFVKRAIYQGTDTSIELRRGSILFDYGKGERQCQRHMNFLGLVLDEIYSRFRASSNNALYTYSIMELRDVLEIIEMIRANQIHEINKLDYIEIFKHCDRSNGEYRAKPVGKFSLIEYLELLQNKVLAEIQRNDFPQKLSDNIERINITEQIIFTLRQISS